MAKEEINNINFNAVFNMEPKEIVEYFEEKGLKTSYDRHEVYGEAHAKAFTVAKMTELDLLKDTKKLLEKSLKEGQSYNQFQKEAMELFAKKGWTGKRIDVDSEGNAKVVELGTPRRIKKIFNCNMNSAYAVGRYKELCEEADVAPYWQYMCIIDEKTRPEHLSMHGKVFRADDDFWTHFFPPNGWNCRCFVKSLTKGMLERKGLTVENSENKISSTKVKVGGEEKEVPTYSFIDGGVERILKPDAGWETNLGIKAWGLDIQAWNKVKDMSDTIKYKFISEMATNPHKKEIYKMFIQNALSDISKPRGNKEIATWISANVYKGLVLNNVKVNNSLITFQDGRVSHLIGDRKNIEQRLTETQLYEIYDYLNNPDEIYLDENDNSLIFLHYLTGEDIIDNRDCIKIIVKLNKFNKGENINYVATAARVNKKDFITNKKYKKIE